MVHEGPRSYSQLFEGGYWSLPTNLDLVASAGVAFATRLKRSHWSGDEAHFLQVSFEEALINAMKHGNKNNPEKKVQVEVKVSRERIYIRIRDEGEGFNPEEVPYPLAPESLLNTSGRGIFMMRNFFDSVKHEDGGRTIIMIKRRKEDVSN